MKRFIRLCYFAMGINICFLNGVLIGNLITMRSNTLVTADDMFVGVATVVMLLIVSFYLVWIGLDR